MPLVKQNVPLNFSQGLDTKTDPKQVAAGRFLTLENGVWNKIGMLSKRNGFQALPKTVQTDPSVSLTYSNLGSTVTASRTIASFNNEQVLLDGLNAYSYSAAAGNWIYKGRAECVEVTSAPVVRNSNGQLAPDSAIASTGAQLYAWEDSSGGVRMSVTDSATGQVFIGNYPVSSTAQAPRCIALGAQLLCVYFDSSNNSVNYVVVNNGVVGSPVQVASDVHTAAPAFDICAVGTGMVVAYNCSANTNNSIKLVLITSTLTLGQTLTLFSGTLYQAPLAISLCANPATGNVFMVWQDTGNNVRYAVVAGNLGSTVLAATSVSAAASAASSCTVTVDSTGLATLFFDLRGSTVSGHLVNSVVWCAQANETAIVNAASVFVRGHFLGSKAFQVSNVPHVTVAKDSPLQPTYFVLSLYNNPGTAIRPNVAAQFCQSVAGAPGTHGTLATVNAVSTNVFQLAALEKDLLFTQSNTNPSGTVGPPVGCVNTYSQSGVMSVGLDFTATPSTVTQGQNLLIASGTMLAYDGQAVVEHSFLQYPEIQSVTGSTTGGSLGIGVYGYQVLYEWTDAQGQVHQSDASPTVSITTTTNTSSASVIIPTLRMTGKTNVNVVVFRTSGNGTTYLRLNAPTSPLANDPTTDTVTYSDTASDASIAASQQVYTTGEVENIAAPACLATCIYKNRVIAIPSEAPGSSWWFSKQVLPGQPVQFSDYFVKNVSSTGGPLKACAQLDANLILFKSSGILWVQGEGPAASGTGDDLTEAQALPTDVGCSNPASVVLVPQGLMFQSLKGIYLLDRSLGVSYVGAAVEDLVQGNTVTSALLMADVNQVRFTLSSGVTVVYDFLVGQWDTFTNVSATGAIVSAGDFTYAQDNGLVNQETEGVFNDNGLPIRMRAVSGWISVAGLQGYQRAYKLLILGSYIGAHKLLVKIAYDFNPAFTQYTYVDATAVLNPSTYGSDATYGASSVYGGTSQLYEWRINLARQQCTAIQISIEDVQTTAPYNEGLTLSAFALEVGVKSGLNRRGASASFK